MKTSISLAVLVVMSASATSALADNGAEQALWNKLNYGSTYVLGAKHAVEKPLGETEPAAALAKHVDSPLEAVVNGKISDVEVCWLKLPAAKRVASSATVHLVVENGMVTATNIDGKLPDGVASCITAATDRWAFPVLDAKAELDHALTFQAH
jgi:hypothetical protein